jgi:hypothetical protein
MLVDVIMCAAIYSVLADAMSKESVGNLHCIVILLHLLVAGLMRYLFLFLFLFRCVI